MIPAVFRSSPSSARRTLVDIFDESVRAHADAGAHDSGATALTYRDLADEVEAVRRSLPCPRRNSGISLWCAG